MEHVTPAARASIRAMGAHFADFEELYDRQQSLYVSSFELKSSSSGAQ